MRYYLYNPKPDQWIWKLYDANLKPVATCAKPYENEEECRKSIDLVKTSRNAPVLDKSNTKRLG